HGHSMDVEASYVAEMVRAWMENKFGTDAYTAGYRVHTTIDSRHQKNANEALHKTLLAYDRRHGYRGPERRLGDSEQDASAENAIDIKDIPPIGKLIPALVKTVGKKSIRVITNEAEELELPWKALSWARRYVDRNRQGAKPRIASKIVAPGDIIRLEKVESGWLLAQVPEVQGALVTLDPMNGAIRALVGGFNFYHSKFNRVTQAKRQPGSSFKPFVYAAALEAGFTPASIINDAPIVDFSAELDRDWRPENYSGKFYGPTRLREALVHSRNLVSIRLLRRLIETVGIKPVLNDLTRFGFDSEHLPPDLSLALGSGTVTPLKLTTAYSIFANGGYRVESYFVDRVIGPDGDMFRAKPLQVCRDCKQVASSPDNDPVASTSVTTSNESPLEGNPLRKEASDIDSSSARIAPRVISAQSTWLMNSILSDVIKRGTGKQAKKLGRNDLAGKTGTTNDQKDAWFCGFTPHLVTTAWVGFDLYHPLGRNETGGRAALPMWMAFMGKALDGIPETHMERPDELVTVRIDPETGQRAGSNIQDTVLETFRADNIPRNIAPGPSGNRVERVTEQLF
ncbi:MAG: peptidase, partial [Gammaproteobacteria bacterium]|nr:peptidase [Gammaproteobacteria bacterium]NNJ83832.1 peptidase [Gammaproteobacteria bacterium]